MSQTHTPTDDDMPAEIDFSQGERGKFYHPGAQLNLPVYLDTQLQNALTKHANAKGMDLSEYVNEVLKRNIELFNIAD